MVLNEDELRQQLAAAADQVSAPRLTLDSLASRIRRRRAKILAAACGSLLAVVAAAVAVPIALSSPGTASGSKSVGGVLHPGPPVFSLSYAVTVNGRSRPFARNGSAPKFSVHPGEHLTIRLSVTVPAHHKVTTLWLGISKGLFSPPGRGGRRPAGMHPVLAHTATPLTSGPHTFRLRWMLPGQLSSGTSLWLVAGWTTNQQDASEGDPVAHLVTS